VALLLLLVDVIEVVGREHHDVCLFLVIGIVFIWWYIQFTRYLQM